VIVGVCGVLAALSLAASASSIPTASFAGDASLRVAPDFTRSDLNGRSLALHSFRGRLVLLNFWATWCGPCLTEIPRFTVWQNSYGAAGLQIVGISMDDSAAPVKRAYLRYHLNYPVVMGDAALAERFGGVLGLPLSYLIDRDGRILGRYQGDLDLNELESRIKSLLPRP
jgi:cytochrome c biogenesis protein CcmG, thiol:disulfide interchange protein DsbE